MSTRKLLASTIVFAVCCVTVGSAEDETLGDLSLRVRRQDLDSYWLSSRTWAEYGYRPHISANTTPFTTLPSVFANKNYYAYGINKPPITMQTILGRSSKDDIQMTRYGTWH